MKSSITFSFHALQRMKERGITMHEVALAIEGSLHTTYNHGVYLARNMRGNGHLLLAVYSVLDEIKVITVIDTSKFKKYLDP